MNNSQEHTIDDFADRMTCPISASLIDPITGKQVNSIDELTKIPWKNKKLPKKELTKIKKEDILLALDEYKSKEYYAEDSKRNKSKDYPIFEVKDHTRQYPTKYIVMLAYNKMVFGRYMLNNEGGYSTDNFNGGTKSYNGIAGILAPLLEGTDYCIDTSQGLSDSEDYRLDAEWLNKAMRWFVNYVITKQGDSYISFDSGWLQKTEGYKKEIFVNAHNTLELDMWKRENIGSGQILDRVVKAFNAKTNNKFNNIIDFHKITDFTKNGQEDLNKSEDILYRLFLDDNPSIAFDEACEFWGKWFPELSYLLFMRDRYKYIPVKTTNHEEAFDKLGIDTGCLNICSWRNYQTFIQIHEDIRNRLETYLGMPVSLLDAHSFVWVMKQANASLSNYDKTIPESVSEDSDPFESIVVTGGKEGRAVAHYVTKYERKPRNRAAAIKIHGYKCKACDFDFEEKYGELGKDFIEVHHVKPLYSLTEEVEVNPDTDLICLCANCHRMIHRKRGAVLTLEELKRAIKK